MGLERVLLLFEASRPCWDRENVELAGEDPAGLEALFREGLLEERGGVYHLSPQGREHFRREAAACYLEAEPGGPPEDGKRAVRRHRWALLLDRAFVGRWGEKIFRPGASLPYLPPRHEGPLGRREGEDFSWLYPRDPFFEEMDRRFPAPREAPPAPLDPTERDLWVQREGGAWRALELDLLCLQRYDVAHYGKFPPHPRDRLGLMNTDRLYGFFSFDPRGGEFFDEGCRRLGALHLFLKVQRQIVLPWRFDHDDEEQPSSNWAFFMAEREEEAQEGAALLAPFGERLLEGARPLDIFVLSLEALRGVRAPHETFWDLFAEIALPVGRTY